MVQETEIDAQMRRILKSSAFANSARSRQFLEFCVERVKRGESSQLKETTIAVEVFLRAPDYDPKSDPIVRVHARRVREKLDLYYRTIGTHDPIKIDLPKGGYVPHILRTLPKRKTEFSDWAGPERNERPAPGALTADRTAIAVPGNLDSSAKRHNWLLIGPIVLGVALISFALPGCGAVRLRSRRRLLEH